MKKCKHCKEVIQDGAVKCKHCSGKQGPGLVSIIIWSIVGWFVLMAIVVPAIRGFVEKSKQNNKISQPDNIVNVSDGMVSDLRETKQLNNEAKLTCDTTNLVGEKYDKCLTREGFSTYREIYNDNGYLYPGDYGYQQSTKFKVYGFVNAGKE